MITFLLWNTRGKNLIDPVRRLVSEHQVDVLVLVEPGGSKGVLLQQLNSQPGQLYHFTTSLCESIDIYVRFPNDFIEAVFESSRLTVRRLSLPGREEILLVATHLPSLLYMSSESQPAEFFELSRTIRQVEEQRGHSRTIVVGDLNANPFDAGLVSAAGLNATMSKAVASRMTRTVQGRTYPFFYNPMWNLLGDRGPGPAGSYHYRRAEDVCYYWHLIDQVLIRPVLADLLENDGPRVVTKAQDIDLSRNGTPYATRFSDHFPLIFSLNI